MIETKKRKSKKEKIIQIDDFKKMRKLIYDFDRDKERKLIPINNGTINFFYCYFKLKEDKTFLKPNGLIKDGRYGTFTKALIRLYKAININDRYRYKLLNIDCLSSSDFLKMRHGYKGKISYYHTNKWLSYYFCYVFSKLIYEKHRLTCVPVSEEEINKYSVKELKEKYRYINIENPIKLKVEEFIDFYLPNEKIKKNIDINYINSLQNKAYKKYNINQDALIIKFLKSNYYKKLKQFITINNTDIRMINYNRRNIDEKIDYIKELLKKVA